MKAAVFEGFGQPLAIETLPDPSPGPDQVLVRVGRCGICGSDLHLTENPLFGVTPGTVLGHEFAGEVEAVGRNVTKFKAGDRVAVSSVESCGHCASCLAGEPYWCPQMRIATGGYGQYALANEWQCVPLPGTVSIEDGALVEPMAVALHGVNLCQMRPGTRVLVIGAGPIGLATIYWLNRLGAGQIAVTASSLRRAELAYKMGASHFLAPEGDRIAAVNAALGGPPQIVFECVGAPGMLAQAIDHVGPRGTVLVQGLCGVPDTFTPFAAVAKEVRIQASALFHAQDFQYAVDVFDRGAVEPHAMITDTVGLDAMPPAFEALRHRTTQCKVMVKAWE